MLHQLRGSPTYPGRRQPCHREAVPGASPFVRVAPTALRYTSSCAQFLVSGGRGRPLSITGATSDTHINTLLDLQGMLRAGMQAVFRNPMLIGCARSGGLERQTGQTSGIRVRLEQAPCAFFRALGIVTSSSFCTSITRLKRFAPRTASSRTSAAYACSSLLQTTAPHGS